MSKLFKLKSWVSIDEAAAHLTSALSEPVTVADVLQVSLLGQLKISTLISHHQTAERIVPTPIEFAEFTEVPSLDGESTVRLYGGPVLQDSRGTDSTVLVLNPERIQITGVFDLTLWGGERISIEDLHTELLGGCRTDRTSLDGCFVRHPVTDEVFRLLEPLSKGSFYPVGSLFEVPAVLCIRTSELLRFEAELCDEPTENPATVSVKERATFQKLILGMAMRGYKYDPSKQKNQAIAEIEGDLHELGIGLSDETIRKYLTAAAQSQLDRQKRH